MAGKSFFRRLARVTVVSLLGLAALLRSSGAPAFEIPQVAEPQARIESVTVRRVEAFKHFEGLVQNATQIVIDPQAARAAGGIRTKWLIASGYIGRENSEEGANFVSIGPEFQRPFFGLGHGGLLAFGLNPTFISQDRFDGQPLGGNFHFTSHLLVGTFVDPRRSVLLSYRIQHISNGGISNTNPGVDFSGVELRFYVGR